MRTWTRSERDRVCGACGQHIAKAAPRCEIKLAGVTRPLLRCPLCAGEPIPDPFPEPAGISFAAAPHAKPVEPALTPLRQLVADYKARGANDDAVF